MRSELKNSALLVIDVQDSFFHAPYWTPEGFDGFQAKLTQLIQLAREKAMVVIYVLHVDTDDAFTEDSGYVKPMDFLHVTPDDVICKKHVHNAFTDTGLDEYLQAHDISNLLVSGIRTEQCCETTARVAKDLGYHVDYIMDATHTFPMVHPFTGRLVTTDDIKDKTALVLHGRFAHVTQVDDVVRAMQSHDDVELCESSAPSFRV